MFITCCKYKYMDCCGPRVRGPYIRKGHKNVRSPVRVVWDFRPARSCHHGGDEAGSHRLTGLDGCIASLKYYRLAFRAVSVFGRNCELPKTLDETNEPAY
jgi:hypothetical protein